MECVFLLRCFLGVHCLHMMDTPGNICYIWCDVCGAHVSVSLLTNVHAAVLWTMKVSYPWPSESWHNMLIMEPSVQFIWKIVYVYMHYVTTLWRFRQNLGLIFIWGDEKIGKSFFSIVEIEPPITTDCVQHLYRNDRSLGHSLFGLFFNMYVYMNIILFVDNLL